MSDHKRHAIQGDLADAAHRGLPVEPPSRRLPRRFAAPQWFGNAGVGPAAVRPPLWQRAGRAGWRFLAGLRERSGCSARPVPSPQ